MVAGWDSDQRRSRGMPASDSCPWGMLFSSLRSTCNPLFEPTDPERLLCHALLVAVLHRDSQGGLLGSHQHSHVSAKLHMWTVWTELS